MDLRDILVVSIVIAGCLAALQRPWIGVMLWTWLSVMSPHRYTWSFAYELRSDSVFSSTVSSRPSFTSSS